MADGTGVGTLVGIGVGARVVDMDRAVETGVRGVCGCEGGFDGGGDCPGASSVSGCVMSSSGWDM